MYLIFHSGAGREQPALREDHLTLRRAEQEAEEGTPRVGTLRKEEGTALH